jgi:alpha-2-macroglobulin
VRAGDRSLGAPLVAKAGAPARVTVSADKLAGPIVLEPTGGEAFYSARLVVDRPLEPRAEDKGFSVERAYLDATSGAPVTNVKLGQAIKVRLTVRSPERRAHVAIVDRLPGGFEPILTRFRKTYGVDDAAERTPWWWSSATTWEHQELRDDRMQVFTSALVAGESTHEYLVRATTAGRFAAPPVLVEAMYEPQRFGRSTSGTIEVGR